MESEHHYALIPNLSIGLTLREWRNELFDLLTVRYLPKELAILVVNYVFRCEFGKLTHSHKEDDAPHKMLFVSDHYLLLLHDNAIKIYDISSGFLQVQVIQTHRDPYVSVCESSFLVRGRNLFQLYQRTQSEFTVSATHRVHDEIYHFSLFPSSIRYVDDRNVCEIDLKSSKRSTYIHLVSDRVKTYSLQMSAAHSTIYRVAAPLRT